MTTQNPGSSNGSTPEVAPVPMLRFREALARVRPEAMALDSNDLAQVSLDIPGAIITARGCIGELQALRPRIVADLPNFDVERFDKIETYPFALTQANGDYLSSSAPPMPIAELTEELKGIRDMLVSDVTAAARRGLVDGLAAARPLELVPPLEEVGRCLALGRGRPAAERTSLQPQVAFARRKRGIP